MAKDKKTISIPNVDLTVGKISFSPEHQQITFGVQAKKEILGALDHAEAAFNKVEVARNANKPVDLAIAVKELADKLETLKSLINTLL